MSTPFPAKNALAMRVARKRPRSTRSPHQEFRRWLVRRCHRAEILANSHGFVGEYRRSYCSVSAVPIAQDEQALCNAIIGSPYQAISDVWNRLNKSARLPPSARFAAGRAQSKNREGSHRVRSMVSNSILEHIFEGVNGDAVYRGASFLAGKLGEKIAGTQRNMIDDGTMPGGFGTSPFDGEGVPTRRTVVIENGVLKSYLLNSYSARKLGLKTTATHREASPELQALVRATIFSTGTRRHSNYRRNPGRLVRR